MIHYSPKKYKPQIDYNNKKQVERKLQKYNKK